MRQNYICFVIATLQMSVYNCSIIWFTKIFPLTGGVWILAATAASIFCRTEFIPVTLLPVLQLSEFNSKYAL